MHSILKQHMTIKGNFEDGFFIYQCEVLSKVYQKCEAHNGADTKKLLDLSVLKVQLSLWEQ